MAAVNERLAPSEPRYYTWSFPGSPVKVQMDLAVVKHIEEQVRRGGEAESGLLFGMVDGHATVVSDSQALSKADAPEIRWALAAAAHPAVGYYRIRRQGGLQLDTGDVSLAETLFRDAHQVFLLIQPAESGPPNATFFFRDGGRLNGDFPFLEFPFDSALLAKAERHRIELAQRKLEPEIPAPAAPPAAVLPPAAAIPRRRRSSWKGAGWIFLAACLGAVVVAGIRWAPGILPHPRPAPAPQAPAQAAMGLQAVRQDAEVKLSWNRASPVITDATSGVLSIQDGSIQRVVPLSAAQVHDGSVLYSPTNDQVQIWLTVSGPAATAVESVIVIDPREGRVRRIRPDVPPPQAPAASAPPRVVYLKPFSAPAEPVRGGPPAEAALEPPPPLTSRAAAAPSPVLKPVQDMPRLVPPPAPPPEKPAIAPLYYPPQAIHEVTPVFPAILRSMLLKPKLVEVVVSIDTAGKVVKAEAVPVKDTHPLLISAAVLAAREWKFRPARRGDQAVPGEMVLRFNFKPSM